MKTVRCNDGSEKGIYEDINDVFPLYDEGYLVQFDQTNGLIQQIIPHVNLEVKKKLTNLFSNLGAVHGAMQMQFRAVYAVYQSNPCAEGADEYLRKAVERIQGYRKFKNKYSINSILV